LSHVHNPDAAVGEEQKLSMNLVVENAALGYLMKRTGKHILAYDDISFSVNTGQFVTIVGPSGCGKTSLLLAIAGLRPLEKGRIKLNGRCIEEAGREIAMVFQTPALLPWRTVSRNIAYGLELQGEARVEIDMRVKSMIELVRLGGFEQSYPRELSGGMQQRTNLARALVTEPELLLLDEPLAALDAQTREIMQLELQNIWLSTRKTALLVTHQIDEAIFLGDEVIVLSPQPGKILEIVSIGLPHPRPHSIKSDPEFLRLRDHVWALIQPANASGQTIL
jgi:NitT/TauT family transport system ATP-binding protein